MNRTHTLALATIAAMALAAPALADTIRVKPGGSIQAAVDAAADGDTILVTGGRFQENVQVTGRTGLRIVGRGAKLVAADGAAAALSITGSTDIRVSGFHIRGGAGGGVDVESSNLVHVTRNHINVAGAGIDADGATGLRVDRNHVTATGGTAIDVSVGPTAGGGPVIALNHVRTSGGAGIAVTAEADVVVQRNHVANSAGDGIFVAILSDANAAFVTRNHVQRSGDDGIEVTGTTGGRVSRNVVSRSGDAGILVSGEGVVVFGNRVVRSGDDGIAAATLDSRIISNTVIRAGGDGIQIDGSANIVRANAVRLVTEASLQVTGAPNVFIGNATDQSGHPVVDDQTEGDEPNIYYDEEGMIVCPDGRFVPSSHGCTPAGGT